jgi:hypothetical protein
MHIVHTFLCGLQERPEWTHVQSYSTLRNEAPSVYVVYIQKAWREKTNAYKVLIGKPEGNRPLRKPRRRWEDNIIIGLREIG